MQLKAPVMRSETPCLSQEQQHSLSQPPSSIANSFVVAFVKRQAIKLPVTQAPHLLVCKQLIPRRQADTPAYSAGYFTLYLLHTHNERAIVIRIEKLESLFH